MTEVLFGDVVKKILGNEDRLTTSREYYVGGEHFTSSNLEVKSYGVIKNEDLGYQFHFPFEKGDVLFMTKNPRLRKAGQSNIDGICSIATFVIRTKDETVLKQNFIPIIMQSDQFWSYLISNQSGSVNPFIKWGTLGNYSFNLPSRELQEKYSVLVWKTQQYLNILERQIINLNLLIKSRFIEMFGDIVSNPMCWPTKEISKAAPSTNGENTSDEEHNWLLNLDAIEANTGIVLFKNYVSSEELSGSTISFSADHVLYSKLRPYLNKVVMPDESGFGTSELIPLLPDVSILNRIYLARALMSDSFVQKFTSAVAGTKMPRVSMNTFRKFPLPLPPTELQNQFADFVKQVDKSKFELQQHIDNTKKLQKTIINSIFQEP